VRGKSSAALWRERPWKLFHTRRRIRAPATASGISLGDNGPACSGIVNFHSGKHFCSAARRKTFRTKFSREKVFRRNFCDLFRRGKIFKSELAISVFP
jgi:hypothetical protein